MSRYYGEWFYSDGDIWLYDDIVVPVNTERALVEELRANRNNEDAGLDDSEMGEAEDDSDSDYIPIYEEHQQRVDAQGADMSQVLASISDLKTFMTQRFNDQEECFGEINHRFDTQKNQINEMREQFHRWNTNLVGTASNFFPGEDVAAEPINLSNKS